MMVGLHLQAMNGIIVRFGPDVFLVPELRLELRGVFAVDFRKALRPFLHEAIRLCSTV